MLRKAYRHIQSLLDVDDDAAMLMVPLFLLTVLTLVVLAALVVT